MILRVIKDRLRAIASSGEDRPHVAAMMMIFALTLLGLQDGLIKLNNEGTSLWQFQLLRALFNLCILFVLMRLIWGTSKPTPKRWWAVALRSIFLVGAMVCYFSGTPFLSLSEMAAGLYVFPLFIAVLSGVFLGERVGPRRLGAIIMGFSGSLLILKPGAESFTLASLLPVMAGFCYACNIITTRRLCREESPVTLSFGVAVSFLIIATTGLLLFPSDASMPAVGSFAEKWPYLFTGWHYSMGIGVVGIIFICSVLNVMANISLAKAYQSAEASWLAPFDYWYLVSATFWGFVIWQDMPDWMSILGMGMIAGSGTYVAWREHKDKRS